MRHRFLAVLPLLAGCASTSGGDAVGLEAVADDLVRHDVVFLGEEHDNDCGHEQQLQLLKLLYARDPNLALSMEMFERDVQAVLDDYLDGRLDEATFLESARAWPHYREHYRPLVEFCRQHELPVIAANLPRKLSLQAAREGASAVVGAEFAPRETSAPRDAYWERFQEAMADHAGVDASETMFRFYEAQCLKDDTMAESIADVLRAAPEGERPLVVHVTGGFHSDFRLGTVSRLAERMPELSIGVVSMESIPSAVPGGEIADWVLRVPAQPEIPDPDPADAPTIAPTVEPSGAPVEGGRPALGFMPSYDDGVVGAKIDALVEGGPAEQAGLRAGDVIVEIDGQPIDDLAGYMTALSNLTVGQTAAVTVERDRERLQFDVQVGSRSHE